MSTLLRGILLGLSITAPIGPTNVEVIRRGAQEGWKSARAFCLGVSAFHIDISSQENQEERKYRIDIGWSEDLD